MKTLQDEKMEEGRYIRPWTDDVAETYMRIRRRLDVCVNPIERKQLTTDLLRMERVYNFTFHKQNNYEARRSASTCTTCGGSIDNHQIYCPKLNKLI